MKHQAAVEPAPGRVRPAASAIAVLLPLLLFAIYGSFLNQKIYFVSSDLGRHLKTGEILASGFRRDVLTTNFYSYTAPDFPALNHHWGTGVAFHVVERTVGIAGLQVVFIALRIATLGLFFDVARRRAGLGIAALAGAALVLVMAERTEIRPEIFSLLFAGGFYWIVSRARSGEIGPGWLWVLPWIEIAWVNLHIYYFLGPAILGAFLIDALLTANANRRLLVAVLLATCGATLINPFGLRGAIAPLTIFDNYGLSIAENQSVFFIVRHVGGITYVLFLTLAVLLIASFVLARRKDPRRVAWSDVLLAAGVITMGAMAIRNLTLFALFALPLLAGNVAIVLGERTPRIESRLRVAGVVVLLALAVFRGTADLRALKYWNTGERGLGIETRNNDAAEFFRANRIRGPVFNNYDIGGYLIFHGWPDVRVFVDNRPEAYPAAFFRDVYWPMLKDPIAWAQRNREYGFNAIFFTHGDMSPATQQFLIDRMRDPGWALVFCDACNVIFVRRNAQNEALIARFPSPAGTMPARSPP